MSETGRNDETIETEATVSEKYKIPEELPILPLRNTVAFPFTVMPLAVGIERSVRLVQEAVQGDRLIGLVAMKDPKIKEPRPGQTFEVGTVARVEHMMRGPDDSLQVLVHGLERFRIEYWTADDPYLKARVKPAPVAVESDLELDALQRSLRDIANEVVALSPNFSQEAGEFLNQVEKPRQLVNIIATNAGLDLESAQEVLEEDSLKEKMRTLIAHLTHEKEVLTLGKKIQSEAKEEMSKAQREYFLRQQLKAIQKELGEADEDTTEAESYELKLEDAGLPEEAMKEARRELKRLSGMSPQAAEYTVIKSYLDWLVDLPWNQLSEDQTDIEGARGVLDADHYGLEEVKERIIEYLAVRTLLQERIAGTETEENDMPAERTGAILCFAGPPGVGKTSLGQSIARALGRKFTRMSLGGMRDEAEIRGHRRTYIGAMPGRIVQAIKWAGTRNPVFMLDEVDKIGMDWRGDPSSALLEVLDPAQNHAFRDHYLDVDFDLSDVMFITTANQLETIPPALRDRMEIIALDGYTEFEKVQIAARHLVPRQRKAHGLKEDEVTFSEDAIAKIV